MFPHCWPYAVQIVVDLVYPELWKVNLAILAVAINLINIPFSVAFHRVQPSFHCSNTPWYFVNNRYWPGGSALVTTLSMFLDSNAMTDCFSNCVEVIKIFRSLILRCRTDAVWHYQYAVAVVSSCWCCSVTVSWCHCAKVSWCHVLVSCCQSAMMHQGVQKCCGDVDFEKEQLIFCTILAFFSLCGSPIVFLCPLFCKVLNH